MKGFTLLSNIILVALIVATTSATKVNVPRLRLSYKDLLATNRSSVFSGHHGQLSLTAVFLDEYRDRLFLGGKDVLYSLMLGPTSSESKEIYWPPLPGNREDCIEMGKEQISLSSDGEHYTHCTAGARVVIQGILMLL